MKNIGQNLLIAITAAIVLIILLKMEVPVAIVSTLFIVTFVGAIVWERRQTKKFEDSVYEALDYNKRVSSYKADFARMGKQLGKELTNLEWFELELIELDAERVESLSWWLELLDCLSFLVRCDDLTTEEVNYMFIEIGKRTKMITVEDLKNVCDVHFDTFAKGKETKYGTKYHAWSFISLFTDIKNGATCE